MSERRNFWYLLIATALLLAPFAIAPQIVRAAPPIFLVDTLSDAAPSPTACNSDLSDGDCSLRQAIARANSWVPSSDVKKILFSKFTNLELPITGPIIVTGGNRLPPITASQVQIIASTSFGFPQIEIDANGNDAGLVIQGSDNLVQGLSIYGASNLGGVFRGTGIYITGARNTIQVSFLGIKKDSSLPTGRNAYGVYITGAGASGNVIGGPGGDAVANYISGNQINGVVIANASTNFIQNNFIGLKRTVASLTLSIEKNDSYGIQVFSDTSQDLTAKSQNNIIGGSGSTSDLANIIGGNGQAGINISGSRTLTTTVQGNFIGIYRDTDPDFGNVQDGVRIEDGATGTQIGGTTNNPLVISDNGGYGVYIRTGDSSTPPVNTTMSGVTYIGTTRSGIAARGNSSGGVRVDLAARNTRITGSNNDLRISGNQGPGIWINGANVTGSQIAGALVGTNIGAGASAVPNTGGGVLVQGGAQKTSLSGNTISGNTGFGVRLIGTKTVTITGNLIGLNTARTGTTANTGPGIDVQDASNNTLIGGSSANANYLAGNGGAAISVAGTQTLSTTVSSNIIGLADNGSSVYNVAAGNSGDGVVISGGPQRTTVTANTIGSNTGSGVNITGSATTTATISLNNIGWATTSASPNSTKMNRANTTGGIAISAARFVDVLSNDVRFNTGDAVAATDVLTVTVRSNTLIGQTLGQPNTGNGVLVAGASRNVQVLSNTITLNLAGQATIVKGTSQRVRIQYNRMTGNAGGVLLQGTSLYTGSGADVDVATLPNHGIDPPIYDPANTKPLRLRLSQNGLVSGWVYTDTNRVSSCVPVASCRIQFFRSSDGVADNQGFVPLRITPDGGAQGDFITPNAAGFFSGQLANALPLPDQLLFAATDGNGNTSEFGTLRVTPRLSVSYLNPASGQQSAAPGQIVTYTLSLANSGTIDFTNLKFTTARSLPRWVVSPVNGSISLLNLPANSTKTITVSLKLPTGTDTSVRVPKADTTIITATVSDLVKDLLISSRIVTTTVLATPVVSASTLKGSGSAPPGGQVTQSHRFTNTGNVTVTLDLTRRTVDPADSGFIWATTLSKNQLIIGPGGSADVDVTVTVPSGAQVTDAQGNPIRVTTFLTATAQAPYASIVRVVSGTTAVDLVPSVQMGGNGQSDSAASNAEISFNHSVTNTSNGTARFCLNYASNSGSQVVSFLSQNSVVISSSVLGSCFTLDTLNNPVTGKSTILRFKALIKVTGKLLPTDQDSIRIYLTSVDTGKELANGEVRDTVTITSSPLLPRIWLPLMMR